MKNLIIILSLFLISCDSEDGGSNHIRSGSAPLYQEIFSSDQFTVSTPIPQDIVKTYNLNVDYYKKVIVVWGIPILSPMNVNDSILKNAAEIVALQLSDNNLQPDLQVAIRDKLYQNFFRIVVFPSPDGSIGSTFVPELINFPDASGYSATKKLPIAAVTEQTLDYAASEEPYLGNTLIHELTHSIHLLALRDLIPDFDNQLTDAYQNAINLKLWENTSFDIGNGMGYISKNHLEYLAVGSELWNNTRRSEVKKNKPNGLSFHEHLKENDYTLYRILNRFYQNDYSLNPKAGIYKGIYQFGCNVNSDEIKETTGESSTNLNDISYELFLDNSLYSISKLSSESKRSLANERYFFASGSSEQTNLKLNIPHPLKAPSNYSANKYRVDFSYHGFKILQCHLNKEDLM